MLAYLFNHIAENVGICIFLLRHSKLSWSKSVTKQSRQYYIQCCDCTSVIIIMPIYPACRVVVGRLCVASQKPT